MNRNEFLSQLGDMLQLESPLAADTRLAGLEEWDSLAFIMLMTFFEKTFGLHVTFDDLKECATPEDVIRLAQEAIR